MTDIIKIPMANPTFSITASLAIAKPTNEKKLEIVISLKLLLVGTKLGAFCRKSNRVIN